MAPLGSQTKACISHPNLCSRAGKVLSRTSGASSIDLRLDSFPTTSLMRSVPSLAFLTSMTNSSVNLKLKYPFLYPQTELSRASFKA